MNNWDEIKSRKEESIRESTNNPKPKPFEINGITYNSFLEYMNSKEYKEIIEIEEKLKEEYARIAKEYFEKLSEDDQKLVFYHITRCIYENYFHGGGSYRALLYDKLGFGPDAYSLGLDSGMFNIHNSISTPDENEDRFNKLLQYLKLNLSKKETRSLRHIFLYGFDTTKSMDDLLMGQMKFDFNEENHGSDN